MFDEDPHSDTDSPQNSVMRSVTLELTEHLQSSITLLQACLKMYLSMAHRTPMDSGPA